MKMGEFVFAFAPFIIIMVVFWFILVRPERKRQKEYNAMLKELKVNDKVITKGGIIGTIIKISGEEVIIESERTKLKVAKQCVTVKLEKGEKVEDKTL
ncbi:MAG: preprotein translocase subunit YajC [Sarcina sp.]